MKRTFSTAMVIVLSSLAHLEAVQVLQEVEAAYFHPMSSRFRDIYGGGGIYTFELNVQTWCQLYSWANVSYFHKTGRSIGEKDKTTITLVPVAFGLKYIFSMRDRV